jgi:RsiW-degrading membrane proteinase PrsW (M82 family)
MTSLLIGVLTVAPTLLLLWYVYSRDRFSEPVALLLKTFLFGVVLCGPASGVGKLFWPLVQKLALEMGAWSEEWWRALLMAAIPQEVAKFLVLYVYVRRKPAFNEPLDGVIYGTAVSFGAAVMGNHLFGSGWDVSVVNGLLRLPAHTVYGVVLGAYVGRALFTAEGAQRRKLLALGLGSAIFLHALTDAFLSVPDLGTASLALPVMGLVLFWGWRLVKALRDEQDQLSEVLEHREQRLATGRFSTSSEPVPDVVWTAVPSQPPLERTGWSWLKLLLAGMGLTFWCAPLWIVMLVVIHEDLSKGEAPSSSRSPRSSSSS